jgi:Fur family ferric uptake transcriptional regulator
VRPTYHTRQQDELIAYLEAHPENHHTAAQIRDHLAQMGKPISTATIYRQMERFVAEGTVRKYLLETGDSACYEYVGEQKRRCASHFHCKCEKCGRLIHLDCDELQEIRRHLREHHGFAWDSGRTVFYGICDQCQSADDIG